MSIAPVVARALLGLVFLLFGFDGLFHFVPLPPMPEAALSVIATLKSYRLFYVVKAIEISAATLLLTNRFATLALCLLAPILFNIFWFDLNLDMKSLPVSLVLIGLEVYLLVGRRASLAPLFAWRT